MWMRDNSPTGNNKLSIFDSRLNDAWVAFMESSGQADLVCIEMSK